MSRANNAPSLLDHLEDGAAMDVSHYIGIIWPYDPAVKRGLVRIGPVDQMVGSPHIIFQLLKRGKLKIIDTSFSKDFSPLHQVLIQWDRTEPAS